MQVPGSGKKGAERLILELRDRLGTTGSDTSLDGPAAGAPGTSPLTPVAPWRDQLSAALVGLGWPGRAAGPPATALAPGAPWRGQLSAALVGLGWSGREADTAVTALAPVADEQLTTTGRVDVASLLRQALQLLGRS